MNVRRIGFLCRCPRPHGGTGRLRWGPPRGSQGQETDRPAAGRRSWPHWPRTTSGRAARVAFAPKGSHGQETDRPVAGTHALVMLAAYTPGRAVRIVYANPPRGSHGQETDRPTAGG